MPRPKPVVHWRWNMFKPPACNPDSPFPHLETDDRSKVTCMNCKRSRLWREPDTLKAAHDKIYPAAVTTDTCKKGHVRTDKNTYIYKGSQMCRRCRADREATYRARMRPKVSLEHLTAVRKRAGALGAAARWRKKGTTVKTLDSRRA